MKLEDENSNYQPMNDRNTGSLIFVAMTLSLSLVLSPIARAADPPPQHIDPDVQLAPVVVPQPGRDRSPTVDPNRGVGLTIAGFGTFGVAYVVSAVFGGDIGAIPIAGPLVLAAELRHAGVQATGGGAQGLATGLVLNGVTQAVGLALGIGGAVTLGKARHQARLSFSPGGLRLQF